MAAPPPPSHSRHRSASPTPVLGVGLPQPPTTSVIVANTKWNSIEDLLSSPELCPPELLDPIDKKLLMCVPYFFLSLFLTASSNPITIRGVTYSMHVAQQNRLLWDPLSGQQVVSQQVDVQKQQQVETYKTGILSSYIQTVLPCNHC